MRQAAPVQLVIDGGHPVREALLPYGRHSIDEEDIAAVVQAMRSGWLTTGPKIAEFERAFAAAVGAREAVAVSSGTAALHTAMHALHLATGDEVIVPTLTFAATANCVVFQGATPVFGDVDPATLLLDPSSVTAKITPRTKAIIAVDYAGQPCAYDDLQMIACEHGLALVADACHSLGATYGGRRVGTLADFNVFSLHPVKPITTGEGGIVTTERPDLARRMRMFRNHGITTDHHEREVRGEWSYEMVCLGYNYRLTDFQCALGISQLRKLPASVTRRQAIARRYDRAFRDLPAIEGLDVRREVSHAYHLYVVRWRLDRLRARRGEIYQALRAEGIGVNVHYVPVHLHPFYRETFGTAPGLCPVAEAAYEHVISLPIFAGMSDQDVEDVICGVHKVAEAFSR